MSYDIAVLNKEFRDKSPAEIIRKAFELTSGNSIVSTNFRPLEAVVLHQTTQVKADIPVIFADSGYMQPETYRFSDKLIKQLNLNINVYNPVMTSARRDAIYGPELPGLDREDELERFTELVKLEPFRRALSEHQPAVWFSSLRKEQNPFRETLDIFVQEGNGPLKVNPVFYWSEAQMEAYLEENKLPDEKMYFDPTKIDEKRECGLHKPGFSE